MNLILKNKNIILAGVCIILFILICLWINYLVQNNYIQGNFENFTNINNVNIPLTTTTSCKNFCGTGARCAITGHQCIADIDCPGCKPNVPVTKYTKNAGQVPGNNEAGKLTFNNTPQYSTLTTDIGTQSSYFKSTNSPPPYANFGVNIWSSPFNETNSLFRHRYTPPNLKYTPQYSSHYSTTGIFSNVGPFAANAVF